jgi:Leucine-rich repeat (LRR) protein
MTLMPDCFTGLTALATLQLYECGLTELPPALTALAASLTVLELHDNDDLQLADDDTTTLLTLRKLRRLDLRKSCLMGAFSPGSVAEAAIELAAHLSYQPPLWSLGSLQQLLNLPNAFRAQNGHSLVVHIA